MANELEVYTVRMPGESFLKLKNLENYVLPSRKRKSVLENLMSATFR